MNTNFSIIEDIRNKEIRRNNNLSFFLKERMIIAGKELLGPFIDIIGGGKLKPFNKVDKMPVFEHAKTYRLSDFPNTLKPIVGYALMSLKSSGIGEDDLYTGASAYSEILLGDSVYCLMNAGIKNTFKSGEYCAADSAIESTLERIRGVESGEDMLFNSVKMIFVLKKNPITGKTVYLDRPKEGHTGAIDLGEYKNVPCSVCLTKLKIISPNAKILFPVKPKGNEEEFVVAGLEEQYNLADINELNKMGA